MNNPAKVDDKFLAMVTAKIKVGLPLSEFEPKSMLVTPAHVVERATGVGALHIGFNPCCDDLLPKPAAAAAPAKSAPAEQK